MAQVGRRRQPRDRVLLLARDMEGGAARDDRGQVGAGPQQLGDDGRRADHLLEVVEHEEHLPDADVLGQQLERGPAGRVRHAEDAADRGRDQGGLADRLEGHEPDAVREPVRHRGGQLEREPGLARSARSGQRQQPGAIQEIARPRPARPPDRRTRSAGSAGCSAGRRASGSAGSRRGARRGSSWKRRSGRRSLSRCSPRSRSADAGRQHVGGERPGRLGHQDLAAVRRRRDPGGAVDVVADVRSGRPAMPSPVWRPIRTRIRRVRRPGLGGERSLAVRRPRPRPTDGRSNTTKKESPSVPTSTPPCGRERAPQQRAMALEQGAIALGPELSTEPGRALDVGEQEGHGAGRRGPRSSLAPVPSPGPATSALGRRQWRCSRSPPAGAWPRRAGSTSVRRRLGLEQTVSNSQEARARQVVGSSATTCRDARPPVEHGQLAEERRPAPAGRRLAVADDPDRGRRR